MIKQLVAPRFKDYELIDSGRGYKLERFGAYVLARPEPQAIWDASLKEQEWQNRYHATFIRNKESVASNKEDSGSWIKKKNMPDQWTIRYDNGNLDFRVKLSLTSFKHIGIFPEQSANWEYIWQHRQLLKSKKVLNLFAYTGIASLAFKQAEADVVHLDSVKKNIDWGRENMEASGLRDIRWVVEDAFKFAQREVKRGNQYQAILLDPPAYGRGPDGEKWILTEQLNELLKLCNKLLISKDSLFIMNLYSMGYSVTLMETLIKSHFSADQVEMGELVLEDSFHKKLPTGIFLRFTR